MALAQTQQRFSLYVSSLIKYIYEQGYSCSFGDAYRNPEAAAVYAAQGIGIKNSQHCKRLAIDLNLFSPEGKYLTKTECYAPFGSYWESLDTKNRWGGHFDKPDGNHFETQE